MCWFTISLEDKELMKSISTSWSLYRTFTSPTSPGSLLLLMRYLASHVHLRGHDFLPFWNGCHLLALWCCSSSIHSVLRFHSHFSPSHRPHAAHPVSRRALRIRTSDSAEANLVTLSLALLGTPRALSRLWQSLPQRHSSRSPRTQRRPFAGFSSASCVGKKHSPLPP